MTRTRDSSCEQLPEQDLAPFPFESRTAAVRRYRIHQILLRDTWTNCRRLSEELEIGVRTVLRDIEAMRSQDLPIEYDSRRKAYHYSEPVFSLPSINVSLATLSALVAAADAVRAQQCVRVSARLMRVFRLLASGRCRFANERERAPALTFHTTGSFRVKATIVTALERAIATCTEVRFDYRKPGAPVQVYVVEPHFLTVRDACMYVGACDRRDGVLKSFLISRIESQIAPTGRTFDGRARVSAKRHFRNAFRVFAGVRRHHVILRVAAIAKPFVVERIWHTSQWAEDGKNGTTMLHFEVSDLRDVRNWILRWGGDVEVIEPHSLRRDIEQSLRRALLQYTGTGSGEFSREV